MIPQCNVLKRAPLHSTPQFPFVSNPLWTQLLCHNFIDTRGEAHVITYTHTHTHTLHSKALISQDVPALINLCDLLFRQQFQALFSFL